MKPVIMTMCPDLFSSHGIKYPLYHDVRPCLMCGVQGGGFLGDPRIGRSGRRPFIKHAHPSTQDKLLQNNHHDRRYHHHRRDTHLSHPQLGAPRQLGEAPPAPSGRPGSEEQTHSVGYKHCSVRAIYSKYNPALENHPSIHPSIHIQPPKQTSPRKPK